MTDGITRVVNDGFGNFVEPAENTTIPPIAPAPTPAVQVNPDAGQVVRTFTSDDGAVRAESTSPVRLNSDDLNAGGTGILSTAKNSYGRGVSGKEITKDSIVNAGGMTATVGSLVHAGILKVDEQGNFAEATDADRAAGNTPPPENAGEPEGFAPVEEQALASLVTALPPEVHQNILTAYITGRALTVAELHDYGVKAGLSPDGFEQSLNRTVAAFTAQACSSFKSVMPGLTDEDFSDFSAWAQTHHREELRNAMRSHVLQRLPSSYKALATRWLRATPPTTQAVQAAGHALSKSGDGRNAVITVNGVQMSVGIAARLGLI